MERTLASVISGVASRIRDDLDPTWSFSVFFEVTEAPLAPGWVIVVADGHATVSEASPAQSDFTFHLDGPTARALSASELSVDEALESGRIKIAGDLRILRLIPQLFERVG